MKRCAFLLLALFLAVFTAPARARAQGNEEAAVRAVIDRMFDAMRRGDGPALASVFHPDARLQSVGVSRQTGQPELENDSIASFVRAVGTPHTGVWDERISDVQIRIDGNLASAWMNYTFYLVTNGADRLSHCGVDAFHLFKGAEGWKVIQVTDTRRRDSCPPLPATAR
jgi:uncharacterized protein (TIGR02246 family)